TSHLTDSAAFLNAFDGMESRATAVVLGAVAMLQRDARGRWGLIVSSGNFEFLEHDAAHGFVELQPVIALALARRNQFVLGPPVPAGGGTRISPVLIAISNVKTPTLLVGALEYATLQSALRGTPRPKGFYLRLKGKFTDAREIRPIITAHADRPLVEELATRASTAGADLEIVWGVTREYANGAAEPARHAAADPIHRTRGEIRLPHRARGATDGAVRARGDHGVSSDACGLEQPADHCRHHTARQSAGRDLRQGRRVGRGNTGSRENSVFVRDTRAQDLDEGAQH